MLGIIAGDIIGSPYEGSRKAKDGFELFDPESRFTDDTILSVATADAILQGGDYLEAYQEYYNMYPGRGYGGSFTSMAKINNLRPYDSYGNGSAMRVGPIGWAFETIEETLEEAKKSAECTHNHPEGIKGAQAVAMAMFYGRNGYDKEVIMEQVAELGYDLSKPIEDFEIDKFDVSCQGTIPICMAIFNETWDMEEAIRLAVRMGGDADTNAAIVGGIFEAYNSNFTISDEIQKGIFERIPEQMSNIVISFIKEYKDVDYQKPNVTMTYEVSSQEALGTLFE